MDQNKQSLTKDEIQNIDKSDYEGKSEINYVENDQRDQNRMKRKRRSKNEQEGRSFICNNCGKSYLSIPALTNHMKTKHFLDDPNYEKRGRGRPRKNVKVKLNLAYHGPISSCRKRYSEISTIFFYSKQNKRGWTG